jgi:hypothetical protein
MSFAMIRARGRAALLACCSLAAVLLAVLYVVAPSRARVDLTVRDTGAGAQLADAGNTGDAAFRFAGVVTAAPCRGAAPEIVYGSIKAARGTRFQSATIAFLTLRRRTCVTIVERRTGVYRATIRLRAGRNYLLRVTIRAARQTITDERTIRIRARHAYRVSVNVRSTSLFAFLPITSY